MAQRIARTRPSHQVEESLRAKVQRGEWPVGTMLPSRKNLAAQYGVALTTIERAVAGLLADGTLHADDRRGTFVARASTLPDARANSHTGAGDALRPPHRLTTSPILGILDAVSLTVQTERPDELGWLNIITASLERTFASSGGATHYFNRIRTDASLIPLREAMTSLLDDGAEALAIIGVYESPDVIGEVERFIGCERVPVVYISWEDVRPPIPHVFYDSMAAGFQAAQHLRRAGYGALLFYAPPPHISPAARWAAQRLEGAQTAARAAGLSPDAVHLFIGEDSVRLQDTFQEHLRSLRALSQERPCGIIAANDQAAFQLLDLAARVGLKPGQDFGLVGFDDDPRSRRRGLTTLRPPLEAMGEQAGRLLLRALQGDRTALQVRLRSHLIPRASTRLRPSPHQAQMAQPE